MSGRNGRPQARAGNSSDSDGEYFPTNQRLRRGGMGSPRARSISPTRLSEIDIEDYTVLKNLLLPRGNQATNRWKKARFEQWLLVGQKWGINLRGVPVEGNLNPGQVENIGNALEKGTLLIDDQARLNRVKALVDRAVRQLRTGQPIKVEEGVRPA